MYAFILWNRHVPGGTKKNTDPYLRMSQFWCDKVWAVGRPNISDILPVWFELSSWLSSFTTPGDSASGVSKVPSESELWREREKKTLTKHNSQKREETDTNMQRDNKRGVGAWALFSYLERKMESPLLKLTNMIHKTKLTLLMKRFRACDETNHTACSNSSVLSLRTERHWKCCSIDYIYINSYHMMYI